MFRGIAAARAAALALPSVASAQVTVPPGNSEADQYFETVPNGSGDSSPDGTKSPEEVLTPEQVAELEQLGPDGQAAAALAAATAPDGAEKANGAGGSENAGGGSGPEGSTTVKGASPVAGAASVPAREGLGGLLWLIIIGAGLAAVGFAIGRRRSPGTA